MGKRHVESRHLPPGNYPCDHCEKTLPTKEAFLTHNIRVHKRQAGLNNGEDVDKDKNDTSTNDSLDQCDSFASTKDVVEVDYPMEESLIVDLPKELNQEERNELIESMITRDLNGMYQCAECDRSSHNKSHIKAHVESCHLPPGNYPCNSCDNVFRTKENLRRHTKKHHSQLDS